MKKSCSIILLSMSGFATAASAQNFSLTLVPSAQTIDTSAGAVTITMSVIGDADIGTHMLGGAFSMVSNSPYVQDMTWAPASWSQFNTDGGYAGNGNYNEVVYGQLLNGGPFSPKPDSALGMPIGMFEITMSGIGEVQFDLVEGTPYTLQTVDANIGTLHNNTDGTLSLGSASINLVPTPGALSMLGLSGLLVSRRRH